MSYIISKTGYTEVDADPVSLQMDLTISNRGKSPKDREYAVEDDPERYKLTEKGLEIKSLSELVEAGVESLDTLKIQKKEQIKAAYLAQRTTVNKGITSAVLGKEIDCRESDFVNMKATYDMMTMGGQTALSKGYKCKDNVTYIPCTAAQLGQVVLELGAEITSMWGHQDDLCNRIDACTKVADVEAIEWSW